MPRLPPGSDVVIVDDGSVDGTAALLAGAAAARPWLRVATHAVSRGYGGALASGFAVARGDVIAYMDGDGQFRVADAVRLLEATPPGAATVGHRVRRQDPPIRRALGWLWSRGMGVLFGTGARDVDCGMKVLPRWLVADPPLTTAGAMISTEMLVRARRLRVPVADVGVPHHPRRHGRPSGANPRVILRALREAAAFRWRLSTGRYVLPEPPHPPAVPGA